MKLDSVDTFVLDGVRAAMAVKRRDYHGFVVPKKVYIGPKSVNITIPKEKAPDLIVALAIAMKTNKDVDLADFPQRKDKRLTITTPKPA